MTCTATPFLCDELADITMMGAKTSKKRGRKLTSVVVDGVGSTKISFTEFTESGTSETDEDWESLPPFPDTRSESGRTRNYHYLAKLLFIGNCNTGKTCLLIRYSEDFFNSTYISTIGIDFKIRTITIDERKFKLQIWDTSGHERFRTITRAYYKGASGIFIVYNVLKQDTFNELPKWIKEVKENASPDVKVTLLGNKCDLKEGDKEYDGVDYFEAKKLSEEYGIPLFEVSAKDGTNVEFAITHMVARIWKTIIKRHSN